MAFKLIESAPTRWRAVNAPTSPRRSVPASSLWADPVISALLPRRSTATHWDSDVAISDGRGVLIHYGHGVCDEHAASRAIENTVNVTVTVFVRLTRNWTRSTPIPQGCLSVLSLDSTVIVLPDNLGGRQILDGSRR